MIFFDVPSTDGKHVLKGRIYEPQGPVKGSVHVVHGMTEHIGRYEKTMAELAEQGYLVFGYDHLGHGKTAENEEELGFFAEKDGWRILVRDVLAFEEAVEKKYGRLPLTLLGHSMGSFIVRLAAAEKAPDRLVVMGTGTANAIARPGRALIAAMVLTGGSHGRSKLADKLAFGAFNQRFKEENDPLSWLSSDKNVREANRRDPLCGFPFTNAALRDLIDLNLHCNEKAWYEKMPAKLPVLLVSGTDDPVGDYSRGVKIVEEKLALRGVPVRTVLYEGARHEILNDFTHDRVIKELLTFMEEEK